MSVASKSATFSSKVVADFEDAIDKLDRLLTKEHESELEAARAELKTGEIKLRLDRAQFEVMQLEWEASKFGGSSDTPDILHLVADISNFHTINSDLKGSKIKLKAKCQRLETEISNLRIENADKLKENQNMVEQVKDENKSLLAEISILMDYKLKSEAYLNKSREESKHLDSENSELRNEKKRMENKLKESQAELEQVMKANKSLAEHGGKEIERVKRGNTSLQAANKRLVSLTSLKVGNPIVFFDMEILGKPVGSIVMELYANSSPRLAEVFRTLCTGEKVLPGSDRLVGYKGTEITCVNPGKHLFGGNVRVKDTTEFESIYGVVSIEDILGRKNHTHRGPGDLVVSVQNRETSKSYSFVLNGSSGTPMLNQALIGRIVQGMDVVDAKNTGALFGYQPPGFFVIADCGQLL